MPTPANSRNISVSQAISSSVWFLSWLYETHFDRAALGKLSQMIDARMAGPNSEPIGRTLRYFVDQTLIVQNSPKDRLDQLRLDGKRVFHGIFAAGTLFGDSEILDELHRIIETALPGATGVRPPAARPPVAAPVSSPAAVPQPPPAPANAPQPQTYVQPPTPPGFHTPPPPIPPSMPSHGQTPPQQAAQNSTHYIDDRYREALDAFQMKKYLAQRDNWLSQEIKIDEMINQNIAKIWR